MLSHFHLNLLIFTLSLVLQLPCANSSAKEGKYETFPMTGAYFEEQDVDLYDSVAPVIFKIKKPKWIDQFPLFLGYPCNTDKYNEATLCPIFYYMHKQLAPQLEIAMEISSAKLPVTEMDVVFDCDQVSKHFMSFRLTDAMMSLYLERLRKCTDHKIWEGDLQTDEGDENFRSVYDKIVGRFMEEYHNRLPTGSRENKAAELNHRLGLSSVAISHLQALGDRWTNGLSECKAGFIPEALIPPDKLSGALDTLEKLVNSETYNFKFTLPFAGPQVSRYYKAPLADCVMTENILYIRVLVPIVRKMKTPATLIKIKSTPFHSQSDVHQLCLMRGFEHGRYFNLGVQQTGTITASLAMEVTCDTSNFHLCKIPAPLDTVVDADTDCARSLITYDFSGSEEAKFNVISACPLDCRNLDVEKFPIVIKSKDAVNTVYLIMNPDNQEQGMFLECEKKDDSMVIKPPVTGVLAMQIPCRCKVVLKSMTIYPVMTTCKEDFSIANAIPFIWDGANKV